MTFRPPCNTCYDAPASCSAHDGGYKYRVDILQVALLMASQLELMSLPDDLLQQIFLALMQETISFINFALCNCRTLGILVQNKAACQQRLSHRPWYIRGKTLKLDAEYAWGITADCDEMQHALQLLQMGRVHILELNTDVELNVQKAIPGVITGYVAQVSDIIVAELLQGWPVNKLVLHYGARQFRRR